MKISFFILLLSLTAPFFQFNIASADPVTMDSPYSMSMEPQPNQPSSSMNSMSTDMSSPSSTESYWHQVRGDPFELSGQIRTYYLAAEEVIWDFAPDGYNKANGSAFGDTALEFMETKADRIGSKYVKCLYFEYTSDKFDERRERPSEEAYLGMLGPIIRAEVGDIIKVVFLNRCRFAASVHPHGVFYNKDSEGAPYNDHTSAQDKLDDGVPTGDTHTYTWYVPERAGPGSMDGSSVMWMYHSHTDENKDFYEGLCGAMAVTRKGMALPDGRPKDVDHELFIMYSVSNENASPYLNESFAKFSLSPAGTPPPVSDPGFVNSNEKHAINGYMYGNGPLITVNKEDRVRWYVMSMGTIFDGHTPHWHGNVVLVAGMRMDVISLQAAEMVVADMVPDNPGIWLFHCHVNDHLDDGMVTRYRVMDNVKKPI